MSLALSRWSASSTCTSSWDLSVNLTPHTWHSRLSRSTPAYLLRSARTVAGSPIMGPRIMRGGAMGPIIMG